MWGCEESVLEMNGLFLNFWLLQAFELSFNIQSVLIHFNSENLSTSLFFFM